MTAACVTGSLFASLIFKLKNAPGDAEGFLLGEARCHSVENITDSQAAGTREEKKLCIQSFVCFPERFSFYDHFGRPDFDKIESLLGDQQGSVIGWFSYRRNSTHRISLREKSIHRRLMRGFRDTPDKDFLLLLVTEQVMDQSTVHSTEHSFYHWLGTSPQRLPLELMNLRASAAVPYQTLAVAQLPSALQHYAAVLKEHRSNFLGDGECMLHSQAVETLYKAMLARLKPLCLDLAHSTEEVVEVGSEVERLREKVDSLRRVQEEKEEEEEVEGVEDMVIGNQGADGFDPADAHAQLLQPAEPQTGVLIDLGGEETHMQQQSQDTAEQSHDAVIANQMDHNLLNLEGGGEHRQPSPEENSFPQESQELF